MNEIKKRSPDGEHIKSGGHSPRWSHIPWPSVVLLFLTQKQP